MKTKNKVNLALLVLVVLSLAACAPQAQANTAIKAEPIQTSYADPFAYCAAVGEIDEADARYTGETTPNSIIQGFLKAAGLENTSEPDEMLKASTIWRCMGGKVYACNFGANLPCSSKANTSETPTQEMKAYCQENQGSDFIPAYITGHETIYGWRCDKETPVVDQQVFHTDAAGFISEIWYLVSPTP